MSFSFGAAVGTGHTHSGTAVSITTTGAIPAGALVLLACGRFSSTTTSTLSVTGAAGLTWSLAAQNSVVSRRINVYWALAPSGLASGSTLTVTNSAASTDLLSAAIYFTGEDTGTTLRAGGNASAATSTTTWDAGTVAASSGDLVIAAAFQDDNATSSTPSGSFLEAVDFNDATQSETLTMTYLLSAGGSTNPTGTWLTAGNAVAQSAAFIPASGGGGSSTVKQLAALGVG